MMKPLPNPLTATLAALTLLSPTAALAGSIEIQPGVEMRSPEATLQEQYDSFIQDAQDLRDLRAIPPDERTPVQQQRLRELTEQQLRLLLEYRQFVDSPEVQQQIDALRHRRSLSVPLDTLPALQDNLQALDQPAAVLYPLLLEDRIELILLTPDAPPLRYSVPVARTEVNQAIAEFRQTLDNPSSDPIPVAQQLYTWLIQPVEDALAAAGTEALLYAPDGALRYIPLAALHDGDGWLTERFVVNTITLASLLDLNSDAPTDLRILAAAQTEGTYTVEAGQRQMTLAGIPGAGAEVEAIADRFPGTTVLLNEDFTAEEIQQRLGTYNILHIASNAAFIPGSPQDSFILMGDGDRVTLRDIQTWDLSAVDLVVLSACETGLGGFAGGEEVLGFGYVMQQAGADAAIASLWQVSDGGTQSLMTAFYTALSNGYSKAEALQRAQQALIADDLSIVGRTRGDIELISTAAGEPITAANLSHPYYWAPFILIGNGL